MIMRLPTVLLVTLIAPTLIAVLAACGGGNSDNSDDGTNAAPTSSGGTPGENGTPAGSGSGGATVTFVTGTGTAVVGQTTTVELKALGIGTPGMGAWTIDVAYDKDIVSATCEVDDSAGLQFCNPTFDNPDDDSEDLALRLASANASGTDPGDLSLMTMTFTCNAVGTSDLTISVDTLADATVGSPTDINHAEEQGTITCT